MDFASVNYLLCISYAFFKIRKYSLIEPNHLFSNNFLEDPISCYKKNVDLINIHISNPYLRAAKHTLYDWANTAVYVVDSQYVATTFCLWIYFLNN